VSVPRELTGVIGSPIAHSLSPRLQAAAWDALGLPWSTAAFEVGAGGGVGAVEAMRSLGIRGLSVTMPLKTEVAAAADRLEPSAAALRSVNCLYRDGDQIVGASTDGEGLLAALERSHGFDVSGARCLVVGAGGAARAVVTALANAGADEVAVLARRDAAASEAAALAGDRGRVAAATDVALMDLVVESTPVGMHGTPSADAPSLADPALVHEGQLCVDLVYHPLRSAWLEAAAQQGAATEGGLGMLVHQAAAQIVRFCGQQAPLEAMWTVAYEAVTA
jgi:shikimate dehydrogenase